MAVVARVAENTGLSPGDMSPSMSQGAAKATRDVLATKGVLATKDVLATKIERQPFKSKSPVHVTIDVINSVEAFQALEADWNALYTGNQANQLVFQSHGWLNDWLTAYRSEIGDTQTLAIVTARTNGRLSLVCPFAVRQVFGMSCLTWLGEPASQYGDIITDGRPASRALVSQALQVAVEQIRPDMIYLRKVRDDAAIMPWLKSQSAAKTAPDEAPLLDFRSTTSFGDYCSKYSSKSRKNRRRLRRRLEETGAVTTTVIPAGKAACDVIRSGIAFKQAWLVDRGHLSSALRDGHLSDFLTTVVSHSNTTAEPFVSVMHCGDKPVSVQFGVIANRRLALHMIAYNPETEKSGAGVLHIEDTIAHCIENGLNELDFLAPNAPYKQAWADGAMPVADYVIARSMRARLYAQGYLCSTRALLKTRAQTLPLGLRQSIARRIQK